MRTRLFVAWWLLSTLCVVRAQNPSTAERFVSPSAEAVARESRYWRRVPLPVPDNVILEASGILPQPGKRLLVVTRRGEIWWIDGAYEREPRPRFTRFAAGLHEPLGIARAADGGVYVAQRREVTRLVDTDGDGRADRFETVCKLPVSGHYHEYAYGPVVAPDGKLRVTLNIGFNMPGVPPAPWRGWMMEIASDGTLVPIAAGLRGPAGFLVTSRGDWFCVDNQGEWVGSGRVTHLERGDFAGYPRTLRSSDVPGSPLTLREADAMLEGPMPEVAQRLPGLKLPAVWFPHTILGISTVDIVEDRTEGKFGPFAGQFFVADQGQSKIMRMSLERVKGVWQGAAYAFREGFECGILRLAFGDDGALFVGETARGWGSVGPKQHGIERVEWTGEMPFEIREVHAEPDGFSLTFTRPVDSAVAADPSSYAVAGFTYLHHKAYGSPPVNRLACPVRKVVVSPNRLRVRIVVACLREGYIHEIKATGVRSAATQEPLLHATSYYTLNRRPDGERIVAVATDEAELCVAPVPAAAAAATPKHPTVLPVDWTNRDGDHLLLIGTRPGLKFDVERFTVKTGGRVRLVFRNNDDMLHNIVLCAPGKGQVVGVAAMQMGLEGLAKNFVPDTPDVLYHTAVLAPGTSDTIFFTAPTAPGDYEIICSFPGHAGTMSGILRVEER